MAVEIELENAGARHLEKILAGMNPNKVNRAVKSASSRAIDHAKKVGWNQVKELYTAKRQDVYANTSKRTDSDGTSLLIKGPMLGVDHFKVRKTKKRGLFVAIKRAHTYNVPKGFSYSKTFFTREGKSRLPIKRLYGPSAPQLFGNPEQLEKMEQAGMEMYEKRLMHELERLTGG